MAYTKFQKQIIAKILKDNFYISPRGHAYGLFYGERNPFMKIRATTVFSMREILQKTEDNKHIINPAIADKIRNQKWFKNLN